MGIPHILTEIVNRPIMATPLKLQVIMNLLGDKSGLPFDLDLSHLGHMSSPAAAEVKAESRPVNETEEQYIAVVSALGSLVARNHGWAGDDSGLRSYRGLMQDVKANVRNQDVGAIILDTDSYGGHSAGCIRAANFIREARKEKPIWAVVDLNAYSAGYAIAAACDRVILTDSTAGVGSIGCLAIHMDVSKYTEKEGLNFTIVTFGKYKAEYNMYEPLSKDAVSRLQRSVDQHGMAFAESMADFRGLKLQQVLDQEARCYTGRDAIDMGLADEIASFDETVAMLTDEITTNSRKAGGYAASASDVNQGGSDMTTKERMEALLAADDGPAAIAELGYIQQTDADKQKQDAIAAEQQRLDEVLDVASLAQLSTDKTLSLIRESSDAKAAKTTVQQLRANESDKKTVSSTTTQLSGDGRHALLEQLDKQYK